MSFVSSPSPYTQPVTAEGWPFPSLVLPWFLPVKKLVVNLDDDTLIVVRGLFVRNTSLFYYLGIFLNLTNSKQCPALASVYHNYKQTATVRWPGFEQVQMQ